MAAAGGADRRSAMNASAGMNQSTRSAPCGLAAPLPRGGLCTRRQFRTRHRGVALKAARRSQGIATEQARTRAQGADLQACAPGRTRTCNLRIRSKTPPVRLVMAWSIAAGRVEPAVRVVASRPILWQGPDCQTDCQHHRRAIVGHPVLPKGQIIGRLLLTRPAQWTSSRRQDGRHTVGGRHL